MKKPPITLRAPGLKPLSMGHLKKLQKSKHKTYKVKSGGAMLPHDGYHMGRPHTSKSRPVKMPQGSTLQ